MSAGMLLAILPPLALLGIAAWLRLWNINRPDLESFDEGHHLEQLYLMAAGFRPFSDIMAGQGPLLLDYLYPLFNSLGRDVAAARAAAVLSSLICLTAIYLVARRLGGQLSGLAALALLSISPLFLTLSRKAVAEAPSMAPACLALLLALVYRSNGRILFLAAAGLTYALALLLKPMTFTVLIPILILLARRDRPWVRDILSWGLLAALAVTLAVMAIGPALLYPEFVTNRRLAASLGWSLQGNLTELIEQLRSDLALVGLALAAIWPLARAAPFYAYVAIGWFGGTLIMLLFYSPLHGGKQVSYLLPAAALLAGGGVWAAMQGQGGMRSVRRLASLAPLSLALAWYVVALKPSLQADWRLVAEDTSSPDERSDVADVLGLIAQVSSPGDYLVTDHPYLAFLASRAVPPRLVEPSYTRLASKSLRQQDFVRETRRFKPEAVVFWSRRSRELAEYAEWLEDDYSLVRVYGSLGAVYLRNAQPHLAPVAGSAEGGPVRFGDIVGLNSIETQRVGPGRDYLVTLSWEALKRVPPDAVAHLELHASDGAAFARGEALLPAWRKEPWPQGHRLMQRRWLDLDGVGEGEYSLALRVTPEPGGEALAPSPDPGGSSQLGLTPGTVVLGELVLP
jgi:hypothetical protein